jgi:hypothetical protein
VVRQRCAANPVFGVPHKVTTVDRFQGQQNDCILLSYPLLLAIFIVRCTLLRSVFVPYVTYSFIMIVFRGSAVL